MSGTIVIVAVLAVAAVAALGIIIFRLQRRAQDAVPRVADGEAAGRDRVVAVEADGSVVTESEEPHDRVPRDPAGFEKVLREELDELHRRGTDEQERRDD